MNSSDVLNEPLSARFDKKIQLSSSANKLSSRRYQSVTKGDYLSEETDSKMSNCSPESGVEDTPQERISQPVVRNYLSNMSSNPSLKINNSELELISSNDFKKENAVKLELKYSDESSSFKQTPKNVSEVI